MVRRTRALWLAFSLLYAASAATALAEPPSPTPRSMVEMPRIVAIDGAGAPTPATLSLSSPDGRWLLFRVRRAAIDRDRNVDQILLLSRSSVERFLSTGASPPAADPVLSVESRDYSDGLHGLRWLDDRTVGFLAPDEAGITQAFALDVISRARRQLTRSLTAVVAFDRVGEQVAYEAIERLPADEARVAVDVSSARLEDLLFDSRDQNFPRLRIFVTRAGDARARPVDLPPFRMLPYFQRIWMSPDGRQAVILYPAVAAPPDWARYRTRNNALDGFLQDRRSDDPEDPTLALRHRFLLIGLEDGSARPLLDAPDGWMSFNATMPQAFWSADGRRVVLLNAYQPLEGRLEQFALAPGIIEVDPASGTWHSVGADAPRGLAALLDPLGHVTDAEWAAAAGRLILSLAGPNGAVRVQLTGHDGHWTVQPLPPALEDSLLVLDQGPNQRPRLFAEHRGRRRMIYDPDPDAATLRFAVARELRWTDNNGLSWRGSLLIPPELSTPTPLPLVVQTHGYDPAEFLIDGARGDATSMAAQALVGAGFAVLQVEENRGAFTSDRREAELNAEGYRAAIAEAVRQGWADPQRVGLTAWSRTGLSSILLLARHPNLLRALQLSDGAWWGFLNELAVQNGSRDLWVAYRALVGPSPATAGMPAWADANPLYAAAASTAAVRITANGRFSLLTHWEHFTVLRARSAPTEIVWFPRGRHDLESPAERFESQQGTVDFFRRTLASPSIMPPSSGSTVGAGTTENPSGGSASPQ